MPTPLRLMLTTRPHEVSRVIVPGQLHAAVALQQGDHVVPLKATDLEVLELTRAAAWREAEALMHRTSAPHDLVPVDTLPGLLVLASGDGLAASRLLMLPKLLEPLPLGGLLAAVPSPSQLFVAPLSSASGLDALQHLALTLTHAVEQAEEPLSNQLFWYDGDAWRHLRVASEGEDITVRPPQGFLATMNRLAAMDLVRVAAEA